MGQFGVVGDSADFVDILECEFNCANAAISLSQAATVSVEKSTYADFYYFFL
jgi:hypothetical protein